MLHPRKNRGKKISLEKGNGTNNTKSISFLTSLPLLSLPLTTPYSNLIQLISSFKQLSIGKLLRSMQIITTWHLRCHSFRSSRWGWKAAWALMVQVNKGILWVFFRDRGCWDLLEGYNFILSNSAYNTSVRKQVWTDTISAHGDLPWHRLRRSSAGLPCF